MLSCNVQLGQQSLLHTHSLYPTQKPLLDKVRRPSFSHLHTNVCFMVLTYGCLLAALHCVSWGNNSAPLPPAAAGGHVQTWCCWRAGSGVSACFCAGWDLPGGCVFSQTPSSASSSSTSKASYCPGNQQLCPASPGPQQGCCASHSPQEKSLPTLGDCQECIQQQ